VRGCGGGAECDSRCPRLADTLLALSKEDLVALILAQAEQIAALQARVAALEAKLGRPERPCKARRGHPGVARACVRSRPRGGGVCAEVSALRAGAEQSRSARGGRARPCRAAAGAAHGDADAVPSRRLPGLRALLCATARRTGERLAVRARAVRADHPSARHPGDRLRTTCPAAGGGVRPDPQRGGRSPTSWPARGRRCWPPLRRSPRRCAPARWSAPTRPRRGSAARPGGSGVLLSSTAIYHLIMPRRAAAVVEDFLADARPEVWVVGRYRGQTGHGAVERPVRLTFTPKLDGD